MRNKNNTETNRRKTEIAPDEDTLILVISAAIVSFALGFAVASAFAAGYYTASAQIAAMMAAQ